MCMEFVTTSIMILWLAHQRKLILKVWGLLHWSLILLISYLIDANWLVFVFCHYDLGKLQQGTAGDSHVTEVGKRSISWSTYGKHNIIIMTHLHWGIPAPLNNYCEYCRHEGCYAEKKNRLSNLPLMIVKEVPSLSWMRGRKYFAIRKLGISLPSEMVYGNKLS